MRIRSNYAKSRTGLISKPRLQRYMSDVFAAPFNSSDT